MRDQTKTLLYKWFNEVWNDNRIESINTLMAPHGYAHGIVAPGQPKGPAGFKIFYDDFREQFKDIKIDIKDVIAQDNMEAALTDVTATHKETGKQVNFSGLCFVRVEKGQIAEAWNHYDFLGLYQQLGLISMSLNKNNEV